MTTLLPSAEAPDTMPLLNIDDIHVTISGRPLLSDVNINVHSRELLGLVGPNGAGKTTLIRTITALLTPTAGHITINGRSVLEVDRGELARMVAVVQQSPDAPATMSVTELVLLGRNPHLGLLGRESAHDYAVGQEAMRRAGCEQVAGRLLGTLSGGERRRAFIARSLAQTPKLLLLDEPTANLDPEAQGQTFELMRELAAEGMGVLAVIHDLTLAASYCDRIALLNKGRIVAVGSPERVLTSDTITRVYGNRVSVFAHPRSGSPVIVPSILETEVQKPTDTQQEQGRINE